MFNLSAKKRSQAALEFLTTYGWAFLVILIMIGVLAYFGILSPSKLVPNRCNFGPEFHCVDYQIGQSSFKLRLKNDVGEPIDVTSITLGVESTVAYSCTTSPSNPTGWKGGNVTDLAWSGCSGGALVQGEAGKVLVTINYNTVAGGSAYAKQVQGEVYSTVI